MCFTINYEEFKVNVKNFFKFINAVCFFITFIIKTKQDDNLYLVNVVCVLIKCIIKVFIIFK